MTVREALSEWMQILARVPAGTEIQTMEEGASPGAGAEMVASVMVFRDGTAAALVVRAGSYDGAPRVFASVFTGTQESVSASVDSWKRTIDK